jgi:hypothetical protein
MPAGWLLSPQIHTSPFLVVFAVQLATESQTKMSHPVFFSVEKGTPKCKQQKWFTQAELECDLEIQKCSFHTKSLPEITGQASTLEGSCHACVCVCVCVCVWCVVAGGRFDKASVACEPSPTTSEHP